MKKTEEKAAGSLSELREMLKAFDTAMLVTTTEEGLLRARPMAVQDLDALPGVDLWFVTHDDTAKVAEISYEHNVCVACYRAKDRAYISISARAEMERNPELVKRLWKPDWKAWFPAGPEDPAITIVKLTVQKAEYWEAEGGRLRVLYSMLKATLHGKAADAELNPAKEI
jgi:general stress protein 26